MNNFEQEHWIPSARQAYLLEEIRRKKSVSVSELSQKLFVNEATIRRDLNTLAKSGLIERTYGGAVLVEGLEMEIPFGVREISHADAKKQIGRTAADFVRDGDTIFLDSSSTISFLIPNLGHRRGLKIVTNGAKATLQLSRLTDCEIHCLGGKLRENSLSFIGPIAVQTLEKYRFERCFFSCRGVDAMQGLTDGNEDEAEIRRRILCQSRSSYLLADHSKFGKVSFHRICDLADVTAVVTDQAPSEELKNFLNERGIRLYL